MQTNLADFIRDTSDGRVAENILRKCVHCGFCTATCPTYQLLGDELDGPRGRIYLIKQVLEGHEATATTRQHLDRCLTCRNCETTCPSGVDYGHLVDIGRNVVEQQAPRAWLERAYRQGLRKVLTSETLFSTIHSVGVQLEPILPPKLAQLVHKPDAAGEWPQVRHARRMVVLRGCVQPTLAPRINAAAARVLDQLGISLMETSGQPCCGAVDHHSGGRDAALRRVRQNVDAFTRALDDGAEAIVMTASGCGAMVRDYAHLLRDDPSYAERAQRVVEKTCDLAEVVSAEALDAVAWQNLDRHRLAFHAPCTLQHGQKLPGVVESLLSRMGVQLTPIQDPHLCCGSAGTYSILQPELSAALRERKLERLEAGEPEQILTANIGCLHHLQAGTKRRVRHWIELFDEALPG
jgi:glycolate oxidase iron-sulfur subunit